MTADHRPAGWARLGGLLAIMAALLVPFAAVAAAPAQAPLLRLEQYGLDQGLSQLTVNAIVADDQGFVWIGTQEGLNRFDGHRFQVHRGQDGSGRGLASSSVDSLAFDRRSRLWIGTNDAGLEVIDLRSGVHTRVGVEHGLSHRRIERMLLDPQGGAWLGTPTGVDRIDDGLRSIRRVADTPPIVAMAWHGSRALALDRHCGLWELDVASSARRPAVAPEGSRCIGLQSDGEGLWLATAADGVYRVSADGVAHIGRERFGRVRAELSAFLRRADGTLLFGFSNGLLLQATGTEDPAPRRVAAGAALDSAIQRFVEHTPGVLFVGTHTSGLFIARTLSAAVRNDLLDPSAVQHWPSSSVRSLWSGEHHLLVGTDAGLAMLLRDEGRWITVEAIGITSIRAIGGDGQGGWWVGTHRGLWRLQHDGNASAVPGLPDPAVTALLVEGDTLWVATRGGLARFRDGVADSSTLPPQLDGEFLTSLLRDDQDRLWIGSNERGIYRLHRDGALEHLSTRNGMLEHDSIWALHPDQGATWIGTFSAGLHRLEHASGRIRVFSEAEGLSNGVVYRIEPDAGGRLWLSTNNGLSVVDPASGAVQTLLQGDGLRNREFNSGASTQENGLLLFGGTEGLDVIDPANLAARSPPAIPVPSGLRVLGRRGAAPNAPAGRTVDTIYADRVQLDYRDTVLSLDMVAIDFSAPGAARLRYRIEGIYGDWVQAQGPRAELVLSYLPPGEYPLEMQAAGRDGRFGETRRLVLSVPPPPWRHPLAYLGYALLLAALLAWLAWQVRARRRAERMQIVLLNRTVAERTAELEEANQRLVQSNRQLDLATRIDPLTQVSNRRDLQEWLDRESPQVVQEAAAGGAMHRLYFCMADVDDFKRINDRYGHLVGDEVLVEFADRLRRLRRDRDAVVRWGGEEFMILLRDLQPHELATQVERIRRTLSDRPVQLRNGARLDVSCSIGFAPWPLSRSWPSLGDWDQSVSLADRALYAAKALGKNAWVGVVPSEDIDRTTLMALLAGTPPDELPPGAVKVLHSGDVAPSFALD